MVLFLKDVAKVKIPFWNLATFNKTFLYLVGPKHWNCPLTMIPKRPHNSSHSSILCDVKIMDWPFFWTFLIMFQSFRLEAGSTPELGSSRKIMGGSATKACNNVRIWMIRFHRDGPLYYFVNYVDFQIMFCNELFCWINQFR